MQNIVLDMIEAGRLATRGSIPVKRSLRTFIVVGGVSYAVDTGTLFALHGPLGAGLAVATTVAYLLALVVNFSLNRAFAFGGGRPVGAALVRYLVLCAGSYAATLAIVIGLSGLGLNYLLAKTAAVALTATVNFVVCRCWVFGR